MSSTSKTVALGFIGTTAAIAAFDGGLTNLVGSAVIGAGAYKLHDVMVGSELRKLRKELRAKIAEAEKEKASSDIELEEMKANISEVEFDEKLMKVGSACVGVATFISPPVGLTALLLMALGKSSKITRS